MVRWTNYMKECIEVLETHPDAFPSDKLFCQHIKIQHICEDIGLQFLMDDNTANISITDPIHLVDTASSPPPRHQLQV